MNISIKDLTKIYGNDKTALDSIDLEIGNGLFGLLGPNGAGKTTLMRILVTLMKPTRGTVTIDQFDLERNRAELRRMIGYLPQDFSSFPPDDHVHQTVRHGQGIYLPDHLFACVT